MITNLTPHPIVIRSQPRGVDHTIPSNGVARVASEPGVERHAVVLLAEEDGSGELVHHVVPIHDPTELGEITGLPEEVPLGALLVVSSVVGASAILEAQALEGVIRAGRTMGEPTPFAEQRLRVLQSLVTPGTGPLDGAVRDGGRIVAVTRLVRVLR